MISDTFLDLKGFRYFFSFFLYIRFQNIHLHILGGSVSMVSSVLAPTPQGGEIYFSSLSSDSPSRSYLYRHNSEDYSFSTLHIQTVSEPHALDLRVLPSSLRNYILTTDYCIISG